MREQARAAFALEKVQTVVGTDGRAKYKTQLLKLPARLHNNGLGQTMAFYLAQGAGTAERAIVGWLTTWLDSTVGAGGEAGSSTRYFTGTDASAVKLYRRASVETRALSLWLKRFAEAFLEGDTE